MIKHSKIFQLTKNLTLSYPSQQVSISNLSKSCIKFMNKSNKFQNNFKFNAQRYYFSNQGGVQRNLIIPELGYLSIRNSQKIQLSFATKKGKDNILIDKNNTIKELTEQLIEKLSANSINIMCNQGLKISPLTPVEALINRFFFVIIDDMYSFKVKGQLLRPAQESQISESFRNLELPLFIRREIEHYCERVNIWIEAKYGVGLENSQIKIPKNEAKRIIINAAIDPLQSSKKMSQIQQQFQKNYWQVQQMLDKKNLAAIQCSKMVRNRMSLGLFLILANISFIWSGTYIFYSWDIIEPIAYFISSVAGIVLFSRFFKLKRPFSLVNYKSYLINKYMPIASQRVGFNPIQLQNKQRVLIQLQSEIKDYYLKKL